MFIKLFRNFYDLLRYELIKIDYELVYERKIFSLNLIYYLIINDIFINVVFLFYRSF